MTPQIPKWQANPLWDPGGVRGAEHHAAQNLGQYFPQPVLHMAPVVHTLPRLQQHVPATRGIVIGPEITRHALAEVLHAACWIAKCDGWTNGTGSSCRDVGAGRKRLSGDVGGTRRCCRTGKDFSKRWIGFEPFRRRCHLGFNAWRLMVRIFVPSTGNLTLQRRSVLNKTPRPKPFRCTSLSGRRSISAVQCAPAQSGAWDNVRSLVTQHTLLHHPKPGRKVMCVCH